MTKARFYIKDKPLQGLRGRGAEPHMVQEVGYRVHISPYRACGVVGQSPTMQKILNSGLNGTAINLADGRVEVRLEGEKERIEEFYEELKREKPELAENTEIYDFEINAGLNVPDSMRSSQALLLEQLSKGIVYIAGMNENIKGMNEKLDRLPERIAKELKEVLK